MIGRVAVVIITHNRRTDLERTLERLLCLPESPSLVVVDNASSDETAKETALRFPRVKVIRSEENLGAAGRTVGVRAVEEPFVAFCDDDAWWAPGALALAADLLEKHPRLALVTGRVVVGAEEREDWTCSVMESSPLPAVPDLPGKPVLGFLASATMFRREAFLQAGGFERRLWLGGEEALLAMDLAASGWGMSYVREVVVHHFPSPARDGSRRRRLHARNHLWLAWLRRPAPFALYRTVRHLRDSLKDPQALRGPFDALAGLSWVLRCRRVVPGALHDALCLVEREYARMARSIAARSAEAAE